MSDTNGSTIERSIFNARTGRLYSATKDGYFVTGHISFIRLTFSPLIIFYNLTPGITGVNRGGSLKKQINTRNYDKNLSVLSRGSQ